MEEESHLAARELATGIVELVVERPLRAELERGVLDAWSRATAVGARHVLLDLHGAGPADGNGLSTLLKLGYRASEKGQHVHLFGLGTRGHTRLAELHLADLLHLHHSRQEAYEAVGVPAPSKHELPPGDEAVAWEEDSWAKALGRAHISGLPEGFHAVNVEGRGIRSPLDGFGQLWSKTYTVRLAGAETGPAQLIALCKEDLGRFWPGDNRLYVPPPGIVPGAVGVIELQLTGGVPVTTGVRVLHADATSFTFVTLAGHLEAGWITFSAFRDGCTVFQVQSVGRTGDPAYEIGFVLFGHAEQEAFWSATLEAVAEHHGVPAHVQVVRTCLDRERHWEKAANLMFNAGARTGFQRARALLTHLLRPGRP